MSWLRHAEPDHRRIVAVHEAGHVIAGRQYSRGGVLFGTAFHATLTESTHGWRGMTTATRRTWSGTDEEFVVYLLAGAAAARLITGQPGLHGSNDLTNARKVCREIGIDLAHAENLATRFARTHHRHIQQAADRLYRNGQI
ncbi:hypothetical protein [Pseudofrankia sp. BMG5.36]|uniref:hypothetical protein n=1 Tax=Pseudofrankia sp. BMG5.36 TaxID=1834512 RepID=UPI0008D91975|nr:hypothetical protein [Pseudofrankia sp. BMG5.36]OHV49323.1 hypothetical protein BCD48_12760 [Pseudofrankia sp. BMG5.36]